MVNGDDASAGVGVDERVGASVDTDETSYNQRKSIFLKL